MTCLDLPDVTVSASAVVVIVGSLGAEVAQVEFTLLGRSETAHCHCTCRALRSVKTSIVALDIGIPAFTIGRIYTRSGHSHRLLGHIAG